MKTYLVTGGAGFIGSNYIHYMFETYGKEIEIVNYDDLTYAGNLNNLESIQDYANYTFVKGDICDKEKLMKLMDKNDFDFVIHFAAESHVDRSIEDSGVFIRTNVLGTHTLLDVVKNQWFDCDTMCFKENKKFLHVSTDEVYGSLGSTGFFTEKTNIDPHSPYSASKASSDLIVKSYFDTFKMPVNITRCSNNYGPFQFPEKLIPLMINNAMNHKALPVYGDGKNIRDWLYVTDHCRAIDMVTQKGKLGEVYNIGGHNEKENIYIVKKVIKEVSELVNQLDANSDKITNSLIEYVDDRKGHDRRYAIDAQKIEKELGWVPEVMFEDGIKLTIKWYIENQKWLNDVVSGDYQKNK